VTLLHDRFGRLRSETVNGRTLTYTYDEWDRRTSRTTPTWSYDAAGRPTQMVAAGRSIDFAYDAAVREISRRIGDTLTWTPRSTPSDDSPPKRLRRCLDWLWFVVVAWA
jgi:YD repeat-containing protein